jgi:hypothetical protein
MIGSRCGEVLQNEECLQLASEAIMEDILKQEYLNILDDVGLLEDIVRWRELKSGIKVSELDQSEEKLGLFQAGIKNLLTHIRFYTLSCAEFALFCKECPFMKVITDKQKFQIMSSLSLKNPSLLPDNFSTSDNLRTMPYSDEVKVWLNYTHTNKIQCNASSDPLKFQFSVNKQVFIIGLNLQSWNVLNLDKEVEVMYSLMHQGKMTTWGKSKRSIKTDVNDHEYVMFKWAYMLQPQTVYVLHTCYMTSTMVEVAELDLESLIAFPTDQNEEEYSGQHDDENDVETNGDDEEEEEYEDGEDEDLMVEIVVANPNVAKVYDVCALLFAKLSE